MLRRKRARGGLVKPSPGVFHGLGFPSHMDFRPVSHSTLALLVVLAACKGPEVGPPLSQGSSGASSLDSGGSGGVAGGPTDGPDGSGGSGGTGGDDPGSGGGSGGTGGNDPGSGGGSGGGGTGPCADGVIRGTCPEPEFCSEGVWVPADLRCEACDIVVCPASVPACCTGFSVIALTGGTFLPNPEAVTGFTVEPHQVVAEFNFGQAYEVGAIFLTLPEELPIRSLLVPSSISLSRLPAFRAGRARAPTISSACACAPPDRARRV